MSYDQRITDKRVFISGPMTGIEHYNAPAFALAHAICTERGARSVYDPSWEWMNEGSAVHPHEYYMRRCVRVLTDAYETCHTMLLLPGWEKSVGCKLERIVALACGIEVVELDELEDE